jgi:hypothetical protein
MSIFNDKSLKGVADAVSKIMEASKEKENKFHNKLDKLVHSTFGDSPDEKKMKKEEKELSPKQKAIAKLDHPKHKIDAGDLAKLRAGHKPVKEEAEQLDELSTDTLKSYHTKANKDMKEKGEKLGMRAGTKKDWKRIHGMETAKSKMYSKGVDPFKEEKEESCEDEAEEAVEKHEKKMHGKKGEVAKHEKSMHKESFTSLIESYKKNGLKSLSKMKKINEEPDNEQFTKEVEDQKKSMKGEKKQPSVAAASTQGVKIMPEETEELDEADQYTIQNTKTKQTYHVSKYPISKDNEKYKKIKSAGGEHAHATIYKNGKPVQEETEELDEAEKMKGEDPCWKDYEMVGHKMKGGRKVPNCVPKNEEVENIDDVNGVKIDTIEERTLTEPETKKKEEIVKSMKKKMAGFKERYGERAKSVAYATATRIAKEKA